MDEYAEGAITDEKLSNMEDTVQNEGVLALGPAFERFIRDLGSYDTSIEEHLGMYFCLVEPEPIGPDDKVYTQRTDYFWKNPECIRSFFEWSAAKVAATPEERKYSLTGDAPDYSN